MTRSEPLIVDGLYVTDIPEHSKLVRFLNGDGPSYDRMTVVTGLDDWKSLHVQGWVSRGDPLTIADWRRVGSLLFPSWQQVTFERDDLRHVTIRRS